MRNVHSQCDLLRIVWVAIVVFTSTYFSGCAFGRKWIYLDTGFQENGSHGSDSRLVVVIDKVIDKRSFLVDNGLKLPSVGLSSLFSRLDDSEDSKRHLVGRIGNVYGMPCGDVSVYNVTVADHVRKIVEQAFLDAGYSIHSDNKEWQNVIYVSVEVENFWGWMCYAYCSDVSIRVELERGELHEVITASANSSATAIWGTEEEWRGLFVDNAARLRDNLARQLKTLSSIFKKGEASE